MSQNSTIEWTDATWNPVTGCSKVSPGCARCYAETFAERFRGVKGHPYEQGFDLRLWPERLGLPLEWRKPRMIFVNSMSDLFHEDVPDSFIESVFDTMVASHWHTFQVLTKRSARMLEWTRGRFTPRRPFRGKRAWPLNVWLGVSVETNKYNERITDLVKSSAIVRFLSCEPLLGPLDFGECVLENIGWVIVGGESGPRARPMDPAWAKGIKRQCEATGTPFFFKQWGAHDADGNRVGKKVAGRLLEGRTWDEMPILG